MLRPVMRRSLVTLLWCGTRANTKGAISWVTGTHWRNRCAHARDHTPHYDIQPPIPQMKVILEPAYWTELLGETDADPSTLLRPTAEDVLRSWSVSRDGNSPRHDRANLLDRIELPDKSRDDPAGRLLEVRGEPGISPRWTAGGSRAATRSPGTVAQTPVAPRIQRRAHSCLDSVTRDRDSGERCLFRQGCRWGMSRWAPPRLFARMSSKSLLCMCHLRLSPTI